MIKNKNFNKKSLGGPNYNDLSSFWKYSDSLYYYQSYLKEKGEKPYTDDKVLWYLRPGLFGIGDKEEKKKFEK